MTKLTPEDLELLRDVTNQLSILSEEDVTRITILDEIRDKINELLDRNRLDNDALRFLEIKQLLQESIKIQQELGWCRDR